MFCAEKVRLSLHTVTIHPFKPDSSACFDTYSHVTTTIKIK